MFKNSMKLGLCAAGAAALVSGAHADDLLLVDLTVVNQITITATAGLSAVTVTGSDGIGVYLENFYSGPRATGVTDTLVFADLTNVGAPSNGAANLFTSGLTDPGLNIFSWTADATVTFTAGTQAFQGSATWNLAADDYAEMLAGNTSGNLYFPADGLSDLPNAQILGTYRVIPTPGAAALLGLGGIASIRRRR
jgi:hypothetical protein